MRNYPACALIQHAELNRLLNLFKTLEQGFIVFRIDVCDHIADIRVRHQKLPNNIDVVFSKYGVDLSHNPRNVLVDVYQAMRFLHTWQLQIREITTHISRSGIHKADHPLWNEMGTTRIFLAVVKNNDTHLCTSRQIQFPRITQIANRFELSGIL